VGEALNNNPTCMWDQSVRNKTMKRTNAVYLAGVVAVGLTGAALAGNNGDGHEGGMFGRHCDGDRAMKMEMMTIYVEDQLDLTDAQMPAWTNTVGVLEDAAQQRQAMCDALAGMGAPENVIEALDRAELHMETGLATVTELKGAVGDLYEVLDNEQRVTLDEMMKNFRHMRG
jgi:hypothetical protein